jgi:NADH-quinone oxidoreductase subunit E
MSNEEVEIKEKVRTLLKGIGNKRENLIPILQKIQEELGYLPPDAMLEVARFLNIPEIDVYSVATFYKGMHRHGLSRQGWSHHSGSVAKKIENRPG